MLGLEFSKRWGEMPAGEFETGNLTIAIMQTDAFGLEFKPNNLPIEFRVDDVAAAQAELESRGVTFKGDGFYKTDSRSSAKKPTKSDSGDSTSKSKSSSDSSDSSGGSSSSEKSKKDSSSSSTSTDAKTSAGSKSASSGD